MPEEMEGEREDQQLNMGGEKPQQSVIICIPSRSRQEARKGKCAFVYISVCLRSWIVEGLMEC